MSEQDNVALVEGGYKAFAANDVETVFGLMADDVEWIIPGDSAVSGTFRGKEEVGGFFLKLAEKGFTSEPADFFAKGDRVVVLTNTTAGGRSSLQADIWTLANGKLVKFQSISDTKLTEEIYGSK